MEQENPIARNTDPETSHKAADYLTDSGKRKTLTEIAWMVVDKFPNSTYQELYKAAHAYFAYLGMPCPFAGPDPLMKRLADAREVGMVYTGKPRVCQISNQEAQTWIRSDRKDPKPKRVRDSRNMWGLNVGYYKPELRKLIRDLDRYTPTEFETALDTLLDSVRGDQGK